jgi:hypothetical protein
MVNGLLCNGANHGYAVCTNHEAASPVAAGDAAFVVDGKGIDWGHTATEVAGIRNFSGYVYE